MAFKGKSEVAKGAEFAIGPGDTKWLNG